MLYGGNIVEVSTPAQFVRSDREAVKAFLDSQYITREGAWEKKKE